MPLFFNPFTFVRLLVICLLSIILLNLLIVGLYYNGALNNHLGAGLYKLLYVDRERNIPSFFNMLLLLICAVLNVYTFLLHKHGHFAGRHYWLMLAVAFFFLSFDESVAIHESLTSILPAYGVGGTGAFTFAWVIPYGIAAIALFVVCFRFLLALPTQTKRGFMIAGGVFVLGAIGIEMIAAGMYETSGGKTDTLNFALLSTVEETLEMTGLIIFIHYILQYTAMQVKLFPSKL